MSRVEFGSVSLDIFGRIGSYDQQKLNTPILQLETFCSLPKVHIIIDATKNTNILRLK